jgi:hypothetical protein
MGLWDLNQKLSISGSPEAEEKLSVKLEDSFDLNWHSYIAFGIFVGVYLKCTSASIPSGDAGFSSL